VVIEIRPGGDDPVDESRLDERDDARHPQPGRCQRPAQTDADRHVLREHALAEQLGRLAQPRPVVGEKGAVDELGDGRAGRDGVRVDALSPQELSHLAHEGLPYHFLLPVDKSASVLDGGSGSFYGTSVRALALALATVGGVGYAPIAPGTVGSLVALPLLPALAELRARSLPAYGAALPGLVAAAGSAWWATISSPDSMQGSSPGSSWCSRDRARGGPVDRRRAHHRPHRRHELELDRRSALRPRHRRDRRAHGG